MITRDDIQRLIHRQGSGRPILSLYLDMAVNSDNKRTYGTFLSKREARSLDAAADQGWDRRAIEGAFERARDWIETQFVESNKGLAIFTELGGDWIEGLQLPLPLENLAEISERPIIWPLAHAVEAYPRHAVLVVDRTHMRMLDVQMGVLLHEHEVDTEPYPTPHDVHAGGFSAKDFQKRKAEEVRHFFKAFALEAAELERRYHPDDLVLLGTDQTVKQFREFLPTSLRDRIVHTGHAPVDAPTPAILERLAPVFEQLRARAQAAAIELFRERVREGHLAAAGLPRTLELLQEGKVATLIVTGRTEHEGGQCGRCGFFLARADGACPYCGGEVRDGIDLTEAMIRIAEEQEVAIEFAPADALDEAEGAGVLLKF